jgi:hypothetical protein
LVLTREVDVSYLDSVHGDESRDNHGLFLQLFRNDHDHIIQYDESRRLCVAQSNISLPS